VVPIEHHQTSIAPIEGWRNDSSRPLQPQEPLGRGLPSIAALYDLQQGSAVCVA